MKTSRLFLIPLSALLISQATLITGAMDWTTKNGRSLQKAFDELAQEEARVNALSDEQRAQLSQQKDLEMTFWRAYNKGILSRELSPAETILYKLKTVEDNITNAYPNSPTLEKAKREAQRFHASGAEGMQQDNLDDKEAMNWSAALYKSQQLINQANSKLQRAEQKGGELIQDREAAEQEEKAGE